MLLALLCALLAAVAYGFATVLQAVGSRRLVATAPLASGVDLALPARLARSLPYMAGLALDGLGFVAVLVALRWLPLFLVQSAVASSVGVTAVAGTRWLGVRLVRREVLALVGLGAGLVLLAAAAQPESTRPVSTTVQWVVLAAVVPVTALAVLATRWTPSRAGVGLAVAAGLGFGGVGVAGRALAVPDPWWHLVASPLVGAIAGYGLVSLYCYAAALQRSSATVVAAVTFAVETVVPAAIGLAVLGDATRHGWGPAAGAGFVLTVAAAVVLARTNPAQS